MVRSRYRPDPWRGAEWAVVAMGALPAIVVAAGLGTTASALAPSTDPLVWPTLPVLPALTVLVAGLAGVVSPPPPRRAPAADRSTTVDATAGRSSTREAEAA